MPKIERLLYDSLDGKRVPVEPDEQHRLFCDSKFSDVFKYQDLLCALGPSGRLLMAWVGVTADDRDQNIYEIGERDHHRWQERIKTDTFMTLSGGSWWRKDKRFAAQECQTVKRSNPLFPWQIQTIGVI